MFNKKLKEKISDLEYQIDMQKVKICILNDEISQNKLNYDTRLEMLEYRQQGILWSIGKRG